MGWSCVWRCILPYSCMYGWLNPGVRCRVKFFWGKDCIWMMFSGCFSCQFSGSGEKSKLWAASTVVRIWLHRKEGKCATTFVCRTVSPASTPRPRARALRSKPTRSLLTSELTTAVCWVLKRVFISKKKSCHLWMNHLDKRPLLTPFQMSVIS